MPINSTTILDQLSIDSPTIHSSCIALATKCYIDLRLVSVITDYRNGIKFAKFLLRHLLGCECNMLQFEEDLKSSSPSVHEKYMQLISSILNDNSMDRFLSTFPENFVTYLDNSRSKCKINKSCLAVLYIRKFSVSIHLSLSTSEAYLQFYNKLKSNYQKYYCTSLPNVGAPQEMDVVDSMLYRFKHFFSNPLDKVEGNNMDLKDNVVKMEVDDHKNKVSRGLLFEEESVSSNMKKQKPFHIDGNCSLYNAERFITQQAQYLEYCEENAENAKDLELSIQTILSIHPDLAPAYFLSYLNYLRIPDIIAAMQSLSDYFSTVQLSLGDIGKNPQLKSPHQQEVMRRSTRYAALGLASFLARIGHIEKASLALKECIRAAQYVADNLCLQHAACWLYRLGRQDTVEMLYERALFKAGEYGLYYLAFMVVQVFVRHKVMRKIKPSSVFEVLIKSDMLQYQHAALPLSMASCAQKAALWKIYAHRDLSLLYAQMLLHINAMSGVSVGKSSVKSHEDNIGSRGDISSSSGVYHSEQSVVMAYCHLINTTFDEGEISLCQHLQGHITSRPTSSPLPSILEESMLYPNFTLALCQGEWNKAEQAITKLTSISICKARHWQAVLLIHQRRGSEAEEIIRSLLTNFTNPSAAGADVDYHNEFQVSLLLSLCDTYCLSGSFSKCVPLLSKAGALCKDYYLYYMETLTSIYTAHILYLQGMSDQAILILNTHMFKVMTSLRLVDRARALLLYSRCLLSSSTLRNVSDIEMIAACEKSVGFLSQAESMYTVYKAYYRLRDVYHMKSIIHHQLGQHTKRDECSRKFIELDTWVEARFPASSITSSGYHYLL